MFLAVMIRKNSTSIVAFELELTLIIIPIYLKKGTSLGYSRKQ